MKLKQILCLLIICLGFANCSNDDIPEPTPVRTILVYIMANNSLNSYATKNIESMIDAVTQGDLNGGNLIVFHAARGAEPELLQIKKENGVANKFHIKEYTSLDPTDPVVMKQVLQDMISLYPANSYGLILWSHGTSWLPSEYKTMSKAFGQHGSNWMEIDELAQGIPDDLFDFILFDACYMASVECAYELRNKTDYILASPTETMGDGWPYAEMVPQLFVNNLRLETICQTFYNYYNQLSGYYRTATVSLTQTSELENLANIVHEILENKTEIELISTDRSQMQRLEYLPNSNGMLYDFSDFIRQLATDEQYARFTACLHNVVQYEAHTPTAFFAKPNNSYTIDHCCGLTSFVPQAESELYNWYKAHVSWYKAVFPQ